MRSTKHFAQASILIAMLSACDSSTGSSDSNNSNTGTTNNPSMIVGNLTIVTSYEGADTLPTVLLKILQNQIGQGPVDVSIKNTGATTASVTVTVGIQDYTSSPGAKTQNIGPGQTVEFNPTVFIDPTKLATLTTLTQTNYQVKVTILIDGAEKTLLNETHLVNLMAKDAMPWSFWGEDLTPYISLFVTPTNTSIQSFLATAKAFTSDNAFVGYQGASIDTESVSDSGEIPASPITKFFGPTTKGHGTISISYSSADPVYLRLLDPAGEKIYETAPTKYLAPTTYSFTTGSWNFVNTNFLMSTSIKFNAKYWYANGSVRDQVKAIFNALKGKGISYSSTTISFPNGTQKVRFPSDALSESAANCIDGTVLMASALEAIDIEPLIVLVPGHAFLAWRENSGSNEMEFLETTMIGSSTFEEALARGSEEFSQYSSAGTAKLVDIKKARQLGLLPAARKAE